MQGVSGMWKMLVAVAVLSALTFTTRLAAADDPAPEIKDRSTAFTLSVGGTAVSIGLVLGGVSARSGTLAGAGLLASLVAPSAGEIYAGKLFTAGMGLRAVSAGIGIIGFGEELGCLGAAASCQTNNSGGALIVVGAIGYATGVLYDIATAGSAVDDYNQRLRLHVTPTVIPTASSGSAVGVGIGGSF